MLASGAAVAMVGLAETLSAAAVRLAERLPHRRRPGAVGTGAANLAAGFSGGIGVGGSLSKTAAADGQARSPLTSLATMVLVTIVVVFFGPSGRSSRVILSAVVVHAGVAPDGRSGDRPLSEDPPQATSSGRWRRSSV
ncbi:MAG: SulP family inorganic anion transporter [Microthrixaceae bacterium]